MQLNKDQVSTLSKYFADISKILVGTVVIAFFVPTGPVPIALSAFIFGSTAAIMCLFISISLLKQSSLSL